MEKLKMSQEYTDFTQHKFGPGILRELATKLYRSQVAAYREAVSNALDAMTPYEKEEAKVEIFTNVVPDGDLVIEDYGTGIENYETFTTISQGEKVVRGQVSSYRNVNGNIIGHKGMGKLSFLSLSSDNKVEFYSNSEDVGLKILMTMDGFQHRYLNSTDALPHRGLKIVIKRAKRPIMSDVRLIEYLSKVFAIRIARGLKLYVNNIEVHKPQGFDVKQYELFSLQDGTVIYGNLKPIEKPRLNNIDVFVKEVFVSEINFEYQVEGWVNCNQLELETSRDGILEDNDIYSDFLKRLKSYLHPRFKQKSELRQMEPKSEKQIKKFCTDIMRSINDLFPEMTKPVVTGFCSKDTDGMASTSEAGKIEGPCTLSDGEKDPDGETFTGKPIGLGKSHPIGHGESAVRIRKGGPEKKILAPSYLRNAGNEFLPDPRIVSVKAGERPVVFFFSPDRLVINIDRPSSSILIDANSREPGRLLPLLVRAIFSAYPGSAQLTSEELFRMESSVLDRIWSKFR
jgi:hypothetical protein